MFFVGSALGTCHPATIGRAALDWGQPFSRPQSLKGKGNYHHFNVTQHRRPASACMASCRRLSSPVTLSASVGGGWLCVCQGASRPRLAATPYAFRSWFPLLAPPRFPSSKAPAYLDESHSGMISRLRSATLRVRRFVAYPLLATGSVLGWVVKVRSMVGGSRRVSSWGILSWVIPYVNPFLKIFLIFFHGITLRIIFALRRFFRVLRAV